MTTQNMGPVSYAVSCLVAYIMLAQPGLDREYVFRSAKEFFGNDEQKFFLGAQFVTAVCYFWFLVAVTTLIDWSGIMVPYKIQHGKYPEKGQVKKAAIRIALNHIFVLMPVMLLASSGPLLNSTDPTTIPPWYVIGAEVLIFMVIEDTCFYWAHRTFHHRSIYKYVHKQHHEFKVSVGIASEYAHPLEFLLANIIPHALGPLLLQSHFYTSLVWGIWRVTETVEGHCGYELPFSPFRIVPYAGSSEAHDFHHSVNKGNFASFFTWWDKACGTDAVWEDYQLKIQTKTKKIQ